MAVEGGPLTVDGIFLNDAVKRGLMSADIGRFDTHLFMFIYKGNKVSLKIKILP